MLSSNSSFSLKGYILNKSLFLLPHLAKVFLSLTQQKAEYFQLYAVLYSNLFFFLLYSGYQNLQANSVNIQSYRNLTRP